MTAATVPVRACIEDFLYAEAALLDEWRLDEWLALFTPDARYEVPSTDRPDGTPDTTLMLISDTKAMLGSRVKRLNSRKAHREFPWSRTRRIVGNIRVVEQSATGELSVTANFAVFRTRAGRTHCFPGKYLYRLVPEGESFRIAFRRAELDVENLDEHGTVSIIL
ncbi:aromatic-ring-hydroxylating dioxygenase subunit beta [Mycobacterium intracellulare]|uniref:aromatic-ring-hydroxylating dioxygenase subunit beta n=1 Tax=Mycobacterium intracellulare TaxID=1767 RepID=UPI0004467311|nr:aromatic-ring-hydroxylating dioxygenase subunit beta [Mycobacterium intracellulare]ETZ39898.1 snoaL-like domain protein [Mycobacterium intracellulare MIN_061107_1834]MCA2273531.1 aromatic-ring-hydroxylating dioxygenase subunit beta [Mycobacterium intracellulare]UEB24821.1 aromatic-ring-hydroxylating dioxygenase subunit beta [Mycobacterium intracellulare]BCO60168.1 aromatic-ring-hydroxylating dioxygenase subunit beta [Mycobacterium intracellulare]BCO70785.1 aromatic-ring-hydroxylating dioxyg